RRQNTRKAPPARNRRSTSKSSLANTTGASTKTFFTHWWGRMVRMMPRASPMEGLPIMPSWPEHDEAVAPALLAHPSRDQLLIRSRLDERPDVVLGASAGELEQDVGGPLGVNGGAVPARQLDHRRP